MQFSTQRKTGRENPQLVCPPCPPSWSQSKPKFPTRKKPTDEAIGRRSTSFSNKPERTDTSLTCVCTQCRNQVSCCCTENLETIEEENDQYEDVASGTEEVAVEAPKSSSSVDATSKAMNMEKSRDSKTYSSPAAEEDDPCGEFFDIMRESVEDSMKKSLDSSFSHHFTTLFEKLDALRCQMERSECIISKIYADLNEKISYYGERNAQQFQYLCVRMEHDRLFYQQQQEFFLKAVSKCPGGLEFFGSQHQNDPDFAPSSKCSLQRMTSKSKVNSTGQPCSPTQSCDGVDAKGADKPTAGAKNRSSSDTDQRRSEGTSLPGVARKPVPGKPTKRKNC